MSTIIILFILFPLVVYNLVRIMISGRGILKPDFERVDELFTQKTGFASCWNTWYGRTIYYALLAGAIVFVLLIIYFSVSP